MDPITGFYRDGYCQTGPGDVGLHTICVQMTEEFLEYSAASGNDLSTPVPQYSFPGLKPGDFWCVCVTRWMQAYNDGVIGLVHLEASHLSVLEFVDLDVLKQHSVK